MTAPINSNLPDVVEIKDENPFKKRILTAITVLMAVGLLISGFLNAPWFVPVSFFALMLCSIFPTERKVGVQRDGIILKY